MAKHEGKDLAEEAREKALHILENHKADPLTPEVLSKIKSIVEDTENE